MKIFEIEWMIGDGDYYLTTKHKIEDDLASDFQTLLEKVQDHDMDHILGSDEKDIAENEIELTENELTIFKDLVNVLSSKKMKEDCRRSIDYNYFFLVSWTDNE